LQHTLPKGFRRARNYGFLHPNSKRTIALLQLKLVTSVEIWNSASLRLPSSLRAHDESRGIA
jgi:hypothetical protein